MPCGALTRDRLEPLASRGGERPRRTEGSAERPARSRGGRPYLYILAREGPIIPWVKERLL